MSCPMTASDLSLPRTPVPANLLLTQGATQPGQIFLMERVPHHDGPETVLELLNRPEGFFAFRPAANHDVLLISRSEEHTSELQSLAYLVCRLLLEKKKVTTT